MALLQAAAPVLVVVTFDIDKHIFENLPLKSPDQRQIVLTSDQKHDSTHPKHWFSPRHTSLTSLVIRVKQPYASAQDLVPQTNRVSKHANHGHTGVEYTANKCDHRGEMRGAHVANALARLIRVWIGAEDIIT